MNFSLNVGETSNSSYLLDWDAGRAVDGRVPLIFQPGIAANAERFAVRR